MKTSPDPGINQVDEEDSVDETDEQLSTAAESSVDSSRLRVKRKFVSLCVSYSL